MRGRLTAGRRFPLAASNHGHPLKAATAATSVVVAVLLGVDVQVLLLGVVLVVLMVHAALLKMRSSHHRTGWVAATRRTAGRRRPARTRTVRGANTRARNRRRTSPLLLLLLPTGGLLLQMLHASVAVLRLLSLLLALGGWGVAIAMSAEAAGLLLLLWTALLQLMQRGASSEGMLLAEVLLTVMVLMRWQMMAGTGAVANVATVGAAVDTAIHVTHAAAQPHADGLAADDAGAVGVWGLRNGLLRLHRARSATTRGAGATSCGR